MKTFRRYLHWLGELSAMWAATLSIVLVLVLVENFFPSEKGIRIAGLCLQVVGFIAVLVGIETTRREFNHPPIHEYIAGWLRRAPWITPPPIHGTANMRTGAQASFGVGTVKASGSSGSIEDRLALLEKSHSAALDAIALNTKQIQETRIELQSKIDEERDARESGHRAVSEKLEKAVAGGIGMAFVGAAVMLFGVVLSTAAPELEAVFR